MPTRLREPVTEAIRAGSRTRAGLRALVSLGYFSGRHAALPLVTLAAWALVGLGALLLHARRRATR